MVFCGNHFLNLHKIYCAKLDGRGNEGEPTFSSLPYYRVNSSYKKPSRDDFLFTSLTTGVAHHSILC